MEAPITRPSALRILLVEDNLINQQITKRMLVRLGHEVDIAENGSESIEKTKENLYDLIFMDLMMPKLDGFEAAKQILDQFKDGEEQPLIIAHTANVTNQNHQRCIEIGMVDFLPKPVRQEQLEQKIRHFFPDL